MKGNNAFMLGGVIGGGISVIALMLNLSRIALLFGVLACLALFTASSMVYFSLRGWPARKIFHFDIYDFFRLLIGCSFAVITVCFLITAVIEMSKIFSISFILAGIVSTIALLSYMLTLYIIIDYLRNGRRNAMVPYRLKSTKRQGLLR